uniref:Carboxylic ester hydrolase n=1 Tax=Steinernema glaseri TaxID=37863 RepID=A0A1I7Y5K5_9BILA
MVGCNCVPVDWTLLASLARVESASPSQRDGNTQTKFLFSHWAQFYRLHVQTMFVLKGKTDDPPEASMGAVNSLIPHRDVLPRPRVRTRFGLLEGKKIELEDGLFNIFLGIPYAKPPVGELRFQKPEPPEPWKGIRSARKYQKRCEQKDFIWDKVDRPVGKSEDCLYLNVMAPTTPEEGLPVLVYYHGGGYMIDGAARYNYRNLCRTVAKHGVIVVTVQYRLGFLGYLSTGDASCPGNFGLWDQRASLLWVQENIAAFGGDPKRVTISGQSAGAASVDLLTLSPLSRDLFQQAIVMGGNAETMWAISNTRSVVAYSRKHAFKCGFRRAAEKKESDEWTAEENAAMVAFLRRLPAAKLGTSMIDNPEVFSSARLPLTPVVDGDILPKSVAELRAEAPPKTVMAGVCQYEALLFVALGFVPCNTKQLDRLLDVTTSIFAANGRNPKKARADIRRLYDDTEVNRKNKKFVAETFITAMSDMINNLSVHRYCQRMTEHGSRVFFYTFEHFNADSSWPLNFLMPFKGATHCTELQYLFDVNLFLMPYRRTKSDRRVLDHVTRMWTNFVKYGDPNGDGVFEFDFEWLPVDKEHPERHLKIRELSAMSETFEQRRVQELARIFDGISLHV